jgi:hypothetical protein
MSTVPATFPRHALGWPAGSVRAILAFGVLGYLWLLVLSPGGENKPLLERQPDAARAFVFLQLLMMLILAHFFAAHGQSIGREFSRFSPLGLPSGSIRFLLLGGYLGLIYYVYHNQILFNFDLPPMRNLLTILASLAIAFVLGDVLTRLMERLTGGVLPAWFQDILAWFSLVGLTLLGVVVLVRLVINTSLPVENLIPLENIEAVLAGIISFYYGARS